MVALVSLKPVLSASSPGNSDQQDFDFEREVAARFGVVPNFFRSAPDVPSVIRELWLFAKAAYLDTPIPTLFKERLFVYLSVLRSALLRYSALRLLVRTGRRWRSQLTAMTMNQVIRLLQRPVPTEERRPQRLPDWKSSPNQSIGPYPKLIRR